MQWVLAGNRRAMTWQAGAQGRGLKGGSPGLQSRVCWGPGEAGHTEPSVVEVGTLRLNGREGQRRDPSEWRVR